MRLSKTVDSVKGRLDMQQCAKHHVAYGKGAHLEQAVEPLAPQGWYLHDRHKLPIYDKILTGSELS